jgi:pyruvate,water dikinase
MSTNAAYTPGQIISSPPDFPVHWENSDQAHHLWQLERIHFDEPLPPLAAAVWQTQISPAFNQVAGRYRLPIRLYFLPLHGYLYSNYRSVGLPPDWLLRTMNRLSRVVPSVVQWIQQKAAAQIARHYLVQVEPVMANLQGHWQHDWWPELQQHLCWWQLFDLDKAALPELLARLPGSLDRLRRVWQIHFQLIVPCLLALHQFETLYADCFPQAEPLTAFRLLQGIDNSFLQSERALWQLSRQARTLTAVCQIITEQPAAQALTSLSQIPEGQIFLAEWQAFLAQYGRRGHKIDGLGEASWLEDPAPVLQTLKQLLTQPDRDMKAELQLQTAERDILIHQARQRLQGHPAQERFEHLLAAAQTAVYLHEEHNFWIDQQAMFELRQLFLAIGRHLARAGAIEQATDIFYLSPSEIVTTAQVLPTIKQHHLIAERQQEIAHFATLTPPPALGAMPLMLPPDSDPLNNAFAKVFGTLFPLLPAEPPAAGQWQGQAASPGLVRGPARIIHTLADAGRLQPGDVLVTVTTLPPWTPLLGRAAAVITESGGILSHAAIVAREYGIPAVVGLAGATTLIHDGQIIEVNGTAGAIQHRL